MIFFCSKCGKISAKNIKKRECECGEIIQYQGTISTDDDFDAMKRMGYLKSMEALDVKVSL